MRSSRRVRMNVLTAPLTASRRVRPPATVEVLSVFWPDPISSCMLDDRSSSRTMSSPFDWRSACEKGMTGCMIASAANAAASARTTNGRRRNNEARNGAPRPGRTRVNAANRHRTRHFKSATAANEAASHHAYSGCRNRMAYRPPSTCSAVARASRHACAEGSVAAGRSAPNRTRRAGWSPTPAGRGRRRSPARRRLPRP